MLHAPFQLVNMEFLKRLTNKAFTEDTGRKRVSHQGMNTNWANQASRDEDNGPKFSLRLSIAWRKSDGWPRLSFWGGPVDWTYPETNTDFSKISTTNKQERVLKQQIVEIIEHERTRTSVFSSLHLPRQHFFVLTKVELAKNPKTIKISILRQLVDRKMICFHYYVFDSCFGSKCSVVLMSDFGLPNFVLIIVLVELGIWKRSIIDSWYELRGICPWTNGIKNWLIRYERIFFTE